MWAPELSDHRVEVGVLLDALRYGKQAGMVSYDHAVGIALGVVYVNATRAKHTGAVVGP